MTVFPKRFIPAPAVFAFDKAGLQALEPQVYLQDPKKHKFASLERRLLMKKLPEEAAKYARPAQVFDLYCPSQIEYGLEKCICKHCGAYWPCAAAKNRHEKYHKNQVQEDEEDSITDELGDELVPEGHDYVPEEFDRLPVFDMSTHVTSPFETLLCEPEDEFD